MAVNYFTPRAIGWETTLACNMLCKHCGSDAGPRRDVELNTAQALELCAQFDAFPAAHITLTGGETFVRDDWPQIVDALVSKRCAAGIISNGWLVDRDMAGELGALQGRHGTINVGLSIDGDREHHDEIRRDESYDRVVAAAAYLREAGVQTSLITTVNRDNIGTIDHVRELALEHGVYAWQIQVTSEYGRAAENGALVLDRHHYRRVVEAVVQYREALAGSPCKVYTADCLGYHGVFEENLRHRPWHGCHAGVRCLGIQSNGDVKGCLSLLEDVFIEGNAMQTPLSELWHRPGGFSYNRDFSPDKLTGPCAKCEHGYFCRAGCHSTAYSILETVNESPYCVYAEDKGWFEAAPADTNTARADQVDAGLCACGGSDK